jgi:hypothetical protein
MQPLHKVFLFYPECNQNTNKPECSQLIKTNNIDCSNGFPRALLPDVSSDCIYANCSSGIPRAPLPKLSPARAYAGCSSGLLESFVNKAITLPCLR